MQSLMAYNTRVNAHVVPPNPHQCQKLSYPSRLTRSEIVERLLTVEQAYAESQQRLAHLQFGFFELQQQREENVQREKQFSNRN